MVVQQVLQEIDDLSTVAVGTQIQSDGGRQRFVVSLNTRGLVRTNVRWAPIYNLKTTSRELVDQQVMDRNGERSNRHGRLQQIHGMLGLLFDSCKSLQRALARCAFA